MTISRKLLFLFMSFGVISCGFTDESSDDVAKDVPVIQLTEKPDNAHQGVIVRTDQNGNVSYTPTSRRYGSVEELKNSVETDGYNFQPIDENNQSMGNGINFVQAKPDEIQFPINNYDELGGADGSNWWWNNWFSRTVFGPRFCGGSYIDNFSCFSYQPVVHFCQPVCVTNCFSYQFFG